MEENLITFKTNKLAKEKGFNIDQVIIHSYNKGLEESLIKGVSQSLLQKWLREVHNIVVESSIHYSKKYWYELVRIEVKEVKSIDSSRSIYKTYEEALEIGLQESLKLIPEIT